MESSIHKRFLSLETLVDIDRLEHCVTTPDIIVLRFSSPICHQGVYLDLPLQSIAAAVYLPPILYVQDQTDLPSSKH